MKSKKKLGSSLLIAHTNIRIFCFILCAQQPNWLFLFSSSLKANKMFCNNFQTKAHFSLEHFIEHVDCRNSEQHQSNPFYVCCSNKKHPQKQVRNGIYAANMNTLKCPNVIQIVLNFLQLNVNVCLNADRKWKKNKTGRFVFVLMHITHFCVRNFLYEKWICLEFFKLFSKSCDWDSFSGWTARHETW